MSMFNMGQVGANLLAAKRRVDDAGRKGLYAAGEHVLGVSNRQAPIEEGDLIRSGGVSQDDAGQTAISYDTPYAVRQHEDMSLKHDAGRNAKFLEKALASEAPKITELIAAALRGAIR